MSKISTVNTPRNLSITSGSAWARGPPATSPSSANNPSSQSVIGQNNQAAAQAPAPVSGSATPRINGQGSHSRRPSAAIPSVPSGGSYQASPTTLKESVAVSKNVAAPIPAKANVQFGSIDDSNPVLSTSPAAPPAVTDPKQIKAFGSVSAGSSEPAPASPVVAKSNTPSRTDSPAPTGKPKKKLDVNSLFQKTQSTPAQSSTPALAPTAPVPAQQQQQPSTSGPAQPPQDGPLRPIPKQQGSYDSPSMRPGPLPLAHHPNQTPPMQPGNGSYQFTPSHLRQSGNGAPGANTPRSPNFNRAMTNGNMRGPPGAPGSGALGSPHIGHPSLTPGPAPPTPSQTPLTGMPPNMMNVPGGPVSHPQHMPGPVPSVPQGQMPHMPPQMWAYYYPPQYDPNMPNMPNMPPYYWNPHPGHMAPHMAPPHGPQQTPLMSPSNLPTPNQPTMPMPMSPRVPPAVHATPQTPSSPHPSLAQMPAGSRSSFVSKRPVLIKNSAGEMIDLADLSKKVPPKQEDGVTAPLVKKEEMERRHVPVRLETADAHKRRLEEEKLKGVDKRKEEEMAKVKAKRDAEAKERAKRDQEEKERRQREQEEAKKQDLDEKEREERVKREAEEAAKERIRREQEEEQERLKKAEEEKERLRLEAEAKEQARLAEIEAKKREEEEAQRKVAEDAKRKEAEAKLKEEEELKRKEEEARKEEAKKAAEQARLEAEAKQKAEEEAKRLEKEEQETAANASAAAANDSASQASTPLGSTPAYASPARSVSALPKNVTGVSRRPIPGRLDLSSTTAANLPQPLPSALASARIIEDIGKVSYPEGIKAPSSELNVNSTGGRFRYDRDFLMQFMKVCKEKPDDMPSLDAIGLEPSEQQGGFANRRGRPPLPATASNRGAMGGLGLSGPAGAPFGGKNSFGGGGMGQFQAPRSSEERFAAASAPRSAVTGAVPFPRQALGRTNGTTGSPLPNLPGRRDVPQRTQSGRGTKRNDSKAGQAPSGMQNLLAAEPDLHHAENSWSTQRKPVAQDQNSPEFIDRKVKALLNKLTMEKFDSIAEQILEWANRSVNEVDGRTLIQVIRLVFEKATDEAAWSEMYARLCRFLMERISQEVRDEGIKNADGKPIAGGNLFRKYLLNRCQEDFERGWSARETAMLAAAIKAEDDKAVAAAAEKAGGGEEVLYSDEYYVSQKAKRRGLGLVKFIGELFKLQMLTERIMHECIKKLLSNVENPEEEEIESLCKLLVTVGQALDTPKARNHMDIYFARMQELANSGQISSRIQYMLLDIIELRSRKWVSRTQVAAPTTIAEVHQKAERDRQVAEREAALRQAGGRDHTRGGRRDTRDYGPPQVGADGWTTPARPPTKAGDLSNFGKIQKSTTMQFGPSSVFSKKERRESTSSVTRASSSSNMFAALNSSEATPDAGSVGSRTANSTRPPSRKGSIDLSASSLAEMTPQRKRLLLQPRTQAFTSDAGSVRDDGGSVLGQSEMGDEDAASTSAAPAAQGMSLEQAKRKIKEDLKELFILRLLSEAEGYFSALPSEFRSHLVAELVHNAIEAKSNDVQLIANVFDLAASKGLVDEAQFSQGFAKDMEYLEDTSTDSPNAYGNVASLLKGARLSQAAIERLGDMILVEGEMATMPKDKLLKKYTSLTT